MSGEVVALVDRRTGQVHEQDHCPNCAGHQQNAELYKGHLENAEKDLRKARAHIRQLKEDAERERKLYAHRQLVIGIFDFWREATGHLRSKLDGDRFDAIRKALDADFSEEDCRLAIIGAAVDPFVDGKGKRHDGLLLVFRNAEKIEDFANRAARWGARHCG